MMRQLILVCSICGLAITRGGCADPPSSEPTLRSVAVGAGLSIGSAAHDEFVTGDEDLQYSAVLTREFDSVTPYTAMKWGQIHPEPDRYDFTGADAIVELAEANQMRVRGHTLIWGGAVDPPNPDYVDEASTPEELRMLMTDHIQTVMGRYRGRVERWDVVNEVLTLLGAPGDTDGLQDHVFLRQLGPEYIAEALELAHAADTDARLFINENFVLKPGPKQDRYFELVQELLSSDTPLHGVGFQTHLYFLPARGAGAVDAPTEDEMKDALSRFAALGVDVEITELNVHTWRFEGDRDDRLAEQGEAYGAAVRACLSVSACPAVTVWLFTDRYPTTVESLFGRDGEPLLFDDEYVPKPAYGAVLAALRAGRPGASLLSHARSSYLRRARQISPRSRRPAGQ